MAVGEKFYSMVEAVMPIGHRADDDGISGSAMVQFDPVQGYHYQRHKEMESKALKKSQTKGEKSGGKSQPSLSPSPPWPPVFFLHAHFPEFNSATIFGDQVTRPTYDTDGKTYSSARIIPEDVVERFGCDVE